jgi:hypothetical protein
MSAEWRFCAPPRRLGGGRGVPTFSVVIAAHNAGRTIGEAVESALGQTLPPLEVIVCDDGSTDDTAAALEQYRGRIACVRTPHSGVASARNAALERAAGEFLAVLDADDTYLPERLEALAALAAARPDLDILSTDLLLEVDGRPVATFAEGCPFDVVDQRAAILERCFCAAPAVRRARLIAVGGYDESLATGEDWECAIRLIHSGAAAGLVDAPLYRYRIHAQSLTADRVGTLGDRVRILGRVGTSYELDAAGRSALARSLTRQKAALALAEAELALRGRTQDARARALVAVRSRGIPLRTRAAALAGAVFPRAAGRVLERRASRGQSRLLRPVARR